MGMGVQVPGWQLREGSAGSLCLRQEWKVRDFMAGLALMQAIGDVAQAEVLNLPLSSFTLFPSPPCFKQAD